MDEHNAKPQTRRDKRGSTCPACTGRDLVRRIEREEMPYGTGDNAVIIPVSVTVYRCNTCGVQL